MDGRVKPVKPKPKKRPRPVNPRYQVTAPVSADGPAPVNPQIKTLGGMETVPVNEVPIDDLTVDVRTPTPVNPNVAAPQPAPTTPGGETNSDNPAYWDKWVDDVDKGLRTPPFAPTPGWVAASRRKLARRLSRPAATPATAPQPSETQRALGMTPQNPFNAVRPTSQQQYGQPTISADGGVPSRRVFPMPVNPATGTAPTAPTPGATVAAPLSRREQLKKKIEERQNKTYNNKRGIKNTLKAAGIGFLQAFAQNAGLPLNERIMASLGGAAAGAVGGTVNPNLGSQIINRQKLADLYGQYGQATEMEEADAKAAKMQQEAIDAGLKVEGTRIENVNKRVKDFLETLKDQRNIDEMSASVLRHITGLPYQAKDWNKMIRWDEQGVPYMAEELGGQARIDPSRPINPAEQVKPRTIEGQTYNVPDKTAFPVAGNVAVGNANRQQSASQYQQTAETTAANREFDDEKDYTKASEDHRRRVLKAKADGKSAQARLTAAEGQLAKLQENRASIAAQGYDTTEIDKQITDVQNRMTTAQGDLAAAQTLASEPAPKKVVRPKNPKKGASGGAKFSEAEIRSRGASLGLSPAEIDAKVVEARSKGMLR